MRNFSDIECRWGAQKLPKIQKSGWDELGRRGGRPELILGLVYAAGVLCNVVSRTGATQFAEQRQCIYALAARMQPPNEP